MSTPQISIITINYLKMDVTLEFLESTRLLNYPNYEIILVDNGAEEDQSLLVNKTFPDVQYIRSEINLGFAGANNLGMSHAKGDYFFIVNNDTIVTPDLLNNLIEPFGADSVLAAVSPKIMYFDNPAIIQFAGFTKVNPITGRNKMLGNLEEDNGQHDEVVYSSYAHGAAMLVKRSVVEEVGNFCEDYFMYYEELDWSARMTKAGYTIKYNPRAVIYHKDSLTIGKSNPLKTYYYIRNRILFMRRNQPKALVIVFFLYMAGIVIPVNLIRYILKGDFSHIKPFLDGVFWNFKIKK
ncbi:MAG: glycosyltransferase family 2 protein [Cyclobacteriaceae bacterium]|nr:glycosyltransferase family 2 protein [Cyclobacteriaceae bacterium]